MKWRWDSDRSKMPVLVVGRTYGKWKVLKRLRCDPHPHNGYRYLLEKDGKVWGVQNDFAVLNKLPSASVAEHSAQMELF